MAHHVRWEIGGAVLAIGLSAGCAGTATPAAPAPTPEALEASIEADIDSLRALRAFDVGGLVMHLPAEATACYGLPCTDADREAWNAERRTQAARLSDLVDRALPAAGATYAATPTPEQVDAALASLRALEIVDIGDLVHAEPANSAECYGLPCPGDVRAADEANAHTAAVVVAIASATHG